MKPWLAPEMPQLKHFGPPGCPMASHRHILVIVRYSGLSRESVWAPVEGIGCRQRTSRASGGQPSEAQLQRRPFCASLRNSAQCEDEKALDRTIISGDLNYSMSSELTERRGGRATAESGKNWRGADRWDAAGGPRQTTLTAKFFTRQKKM